MFPEISLDLFVGKNIDLHIRVENPKLLHNPFATVAHGEVVLALLKMPADTSPSDLAVCHLASRGGFLSFFSDFSLFLIDAVGGNDAADAGQGIDVGISADDCSGVQHRTAANLYIVANQSADFFAAGFD